MSRQDAKPSDRKRSGKSGRPRSPVPGFDGRARWTLQVDSWAVLLADVLLTALLVVFPFVMGGREAWGHWVLISLSLCLGMVWCFHKVQTGGRLVLLAIEPLVIAGLLLVWFQTIPNTPELLDRISPEYNRLLTDWDVSQSVLKSSGTKPTTTASAPGDSVPGHSPRDLTLSSAAEQPSASADGSRASWTTISLTPVESEHAVLMLMAYALIGIVVAQRIQSPDDCGRLLKIIGVSGILMAAFAVVQLATSNGCFFWFYRHPATDTSQVLKGAFTNRNHFSQFLVLSIGPLVWWILDERKSHRVRLAGPTRRGLGPAQGNHSNFDNIVNVQGLMLVCGLVGVVMAALLSLSRGGMVAAGAAGFVTVAGLWKNTGLRSSLTMLIVGISLAVTGGVYLAGRDSIEARVNQLATADADKIDQLSARRTLWRADLEGIRAFPILGTGVGSHREVYPIYMAELADFSDFEFTHAESSYVHLALETGLAGLCLLVVGLLAIAGRLVFSLVRSKLAEHSTYLAAVLASLAGGMVHAAVDFIWYVPAIVVTTTVLVVIGIRVCGGFQYPRGITIPRTFWLAGAAACGVGLILVQPELTRRIAGESYWNLYLLATRAVESSQAEQEHNAGIEGEDEFAESAYGAPTRQDVDAVVGLDDDTNDDPESLKKAVAAAAQGADYRRRTDAPQIEEGPESIRYRISLLIRSLKANPRQPRVQLRLASLFLNLFDLMQKESDNPLILAQIRDVVASSDFQSPQEMHVWLNRAFGKSIRIPLMADQFARQSLRYCPIQWEAYLHLTETGFLREPSDARQATYISQALLVGGNSPRTRFIAGQEAILAGNQAEALKQWAAVFHANSRYRRAITRMMTSMVSSSFLMESFQPSIVELQDVLDIYQGANRPSDVAEIILAAEKAVESASPDTSVNDQVGLLMAAYSAAYELQMVQKAESLLRRAVECDSDAYWPRHALGLLLYENKRFTEASELLLWCYNQQPGDAQLDKLIRDARRRALREALPIVPAAYQP